MISNLIKGVLQSGKFVRYASRIPCDTIQTLETDVDAAKEFVTDIEQGRTPLIIQDLPQEIVRAFKGLWGVIETIPSEVLDVAQAAVTDVVNVVNDIENGNTGAIVSSIEQIPGKAISDVTSDWGEITAGLEQDLDAVTHFFACLSEDCSTSTYNCGPASTLVATTTAVGSSITLDTLIPSTRSPSTRTQNPITNSKFFTKIIADHALTSTSASLTPRSTNSVTTTTIAASPENLGTRPDSSSLESKMIQMCALGLLVVSVVAFRL